MADLSLLPCTRVTATIEEQALTAQSELASIGHHRLAPTDIVIAACAHEAEAGVLHYDRDYDILAEHTSLDSRANGSRHPGLCRRPPRDSLRTT